MVDQAPQWESTDQLGKTVHYSGTVGTSSVLVPASPVGKIGSILVRNPNRNTATKILQVAFDGGTTYLTLNPGEFAAWSPKTNAGGTPVQQIRLVGAVAGVDYEAVADFEP